MNKRVLGEGRGYGRILALLALTVGLGVATVCGAEARIDLNAASVGELTSLPGIGPARAQAIVDWRRDARFESTDDLADVPGIGEALVEKLRDRIVVSEAGAARATGAEDR